MQLGGGKCCCCPNCSGCPPATIPSGMVGGYGGAFSNPCAQKLTVSYCNKRDSDAAVAASVNTTTVTPIGGSESLVGSTDNPPCSPTGAAAFNGDTDANFWNYNCGWPQFLGTKSPFRPGNRFEGKGTVDLSGECREVGAQRAQFKRYWHGMFPFAGTVEGETCSSVAARRSNPSLAKVFGDTKYRAIEVVATLSQTGTAVRTVTYPDGSHATETTTVSLSGEQSLRAKMTVNALTGERTVADLEASNTLNQSDGVSDDLGVSFLVDSLLPDNLFPSTWGALLCGDTEDSEHEGDYSQVNLGGVSHSVGKWNEVLNDGASVFSPRDAFEPMSFEAAASGSLTLSETELASILTITPTAPDDVIVYNEDATVHSVTHCEVNCSADWSFTVTLSDANPGSDVYADIGDNLETLVDWSLPMHPIYKHNNCTVAPLWTRREVQHGVSPNYFPIETYTVGGDPRLLYRIQQVDDYTSPSVGGYNKRNWFDTDCYEWIWSPGSVGTKAISLELHRDGAIIPGLLSAGTGAGDIGSEPLQHRGCFDFYAINYRTSGVSCEPFTTGAWTPLVDSDSGYPFLPPWCQQWTDTMDATKYFPHEFVRFTTDSITVQRVREIQVRVPSENICRPFGADRDQLDYSAADHCDAGSVVQADGSPLPKKWPNCPGMVFSNTPEIGGRVRVIGVVGNVIEVDVAQPYLSGDFTETILVYTTDAMTGGTAYAATRIDGTHFDIGAAVPSAKWITPQFLNDGSTAWIYSDCDNFPKGQWVDAKWLYDEVTESFIGSPSLSSQCAKFSKCDPVFLQATATLPGNSGRTQMACVVQWAVSQFEIQEKCCVDGTFSTRPYYDFDPESPCGPNNCYLPQFVEASMTHAWNALLNTNNAIVGKSECSATPTRDTTWAIYLNCPDQFPL